MEALTSVCYCFMCVWGSGVRPFFSCFFFPSFFHLHLFLSYYPLYNHPFCSFNALSHPSIFSSNSFQYEVKMPLKIVCFSTSSTDLNVTVRNPTTHIVDSQWLHEICGNCSNEIPRPCKNN